MGDVTDLDPAPAQEPVRGLASVEQAHIMLRPGSVAARAGRFGEAFRPEADPDGSPRTDCRLRAHRAPPQSQWKALQGPVFRWDRPATTEPRPDRMKTRGIHVSRPKSAGFSTWIL